MSAQKTEPPSSHHPFNHAASFRWLEGEKFGSNF
jgi:hypothetical protein